MEDWKRIIENIELAHQNQKVFIWGAGNTSVLNHQGMVRENLYEELRVEAFIDSKLAGTLFNGFSVYHPDVLNDIDPDNVFILISTTNHRVFHEIEELCKKKNIKSCLIDAAILKLREKDFFEVSDLLDSESTEVYCSVLAARTIAGETGVAIYSGESYFGIPEFCRPNADDVIIDCGAYVGDSAERYIWRMDKFKQYIAIEPDDGNFRALQKRFFRLNNEWNFSDDKLVALHGGVDSITKITRVDRRVDGLGSIAIDSDKVSEGITFWALDDLMSDGYTFLKADIESYEYRMLCGARKTIREYHPRMAICIYHNMVDMFSIPKLIHEIDPSYHLAVRHHSYGYEETVLYVF